MPKIDPKTGSPAWTDEDVPPPIGATIHYRLSADTVVPLLVVRREGWAVSGQLTTAPDDNINVDMLPKGQSAARISRGCWWVTGVTRGLEGQDHVGCWDWPPADGRGAVD